LCIINDIIYFSSFYRFFIDGHDAGACETKKPSAYDFSGSTADGLEKEQRGATL
jgi:hypothetical protein